MTGAGDGLGRGRCGWTGAGAGDSTGDIFLRNFLFLLVTDLDPSTLTW